MSLIDSYHPSLILDKQDKTDGLLKGCYDFILNTNYKFWNLYELLVTGTAFKKGTFDYWIAMGNA